VTKPGARDAVTADERERLRRDGFFTRSGHFSSAEVDALEAAADAAVAYHNTFPVHLADIYKEISHKDGITFVNEFGDDSQAAGELRRLALGPRIAAMARSLAGPRAAHHCYQVVYKHPHYERPFPWHQDQIHTPSDRPFFNIWVALSAMTEANGCLRVRPGVGLDEILPYHPTPYGHSCWPLDDAGQAVEMTRGSILVVTGRTLHMSGPNRTDGLRKAILFVFMEEGAMARREPVRLRPYPEAR
jgi:phytanoyl-CoA dioxygenase PhyH